MSPDPRLLTAEQLDGARLVLDACAPASSLADDTVGRVFRHIDAQADRIRELEDERDKWERAHHDAFDREATLAVRLANVENAIYFARVHLANGRPGECEDTLSDAVDRPAASLDGKDEGDA